MKIVLMMFALLGSLWAGALPSWVLNPPSDDAQFFYGVGEGGSLRQAKDDALADIASRLSVSVSSTLSKQATQTTNGTSTTFQQSVSMDLQSEVKKITFNNYEVLETGNNGDKSVVLVKVDKAKFFKEQHQSLDQILKTLDQLQLAPMNKPALEMYQNLKTTSADADRAHTIASILSTFESGFNYNAVMQKVRDFKELMDEVRGKIQFCVLADAQSQYVATVMKEALAQEHIKVVPSFSAGDTNTAIIDLATQSTTKKIYASHMVVARTVVSLKSSKGQTLSTFVVESRGASSLDADTALKVASGDFKKQMATKGIFAFLGLN